MAKLKALLNWIDDRFPLTANWKAHLSEYYAPKNLNFWYNFGSLALLILTMQLVTGILLTMHYKPDATLALFLFFLVIPWYTKIDGTRPEPERLTSQETLEARP